MVFISLASAVQGQLTYQLSSGNGSWPADKRAAIIAAMDAAVALYNANGHFPRNLTANYNAGVPTAQASYSGWIDFGGSISTRVALHEISHTLGVGTYWNWDPKRNTSTNRWTAPRALARLAIFDGAGAVLNADGAHFWPYGLNYDSEDSTTSRVRHIKMVSAMRWDMGIVTDSDGDGMPDDWETFHFGDLTQTGTGDWDADGTTNLAEYNADTDPGTPYGFTWIGGADNWDTTTANWTGSATRWRNGGNDTATFGGTAGAVAVTAGISANDLTFNTSGYSLTGSAFALTGKTPTITTASNTTTTIAPVLSGSRGLVKSGTGTLTLSGANTFTGPLTINSGTLAIASGGRLYMNGGSAVTTIKSGATLSFTGNWGWNGTMRYMGVQASANVIDGGTLQHSGTGNAKTADGAGRLFTIGAAGATLDSATPNEEFTIGYRYDYSDALAGNDGGTLTLTGAGNGELNYNLPGTGALVKRGAGTWKLTGPANSFSGGTTIGVNSNQGTVGGIIVINDSTSLGSGPITVIAGDTTDTHMGAQLQLTGGIALANPAVNISGLGFGAANGVILNLSGNNSIAGPVRLTSGAGGSVIASDAGKLTLGSGGITATFGSRTLEFTGVGNIDVNGIISNGSTAALPVTKSGAGTLVFTGANTYSGVTTINGGRLQIGAGGAAGSLGSGAVVNNATLHFHRSDATAIVSNAISGSGGLEFGVSNGGTLGAETTLSGPNSFSGAVIIHSGGVRITRSDALGIGAKTVTMTNGTNGNCRLILNGSGVNISLPSTTSFITSNVNTTYPAIINEAGNNTIAGNFSLMSGGGGTRIRVDAGTLELSGLITPAVSGRTVQLDGVGNGTLSGGLKNASSTVALEKFGTGTWTLNGTGHTFTGTTTIHAGTLRVGTASGASTTATLATSSAITNQGTLVFRRTDATDSDLAGIIGGAGQVVFEGSGVINESRYHANNPSTYSGGTSIENARVNLSNATGLGIGPVTIADGGQVFINAAVNVANAFTIAGMGWNENAGRLGALRLVSGSILSGPITLAGDSRLSASSGVATFSGGISGPHSLEIGEDSATGTVVLDGANTHSGDTTVSFGTMELAPTGSLRFSPTANGTCNRVTGSGAAVFKGAFIIDLTNASPVLGNSWSLVNAADLTESYTATFSIPGFTEVANVWTRVDGALKWTFREVDGMLSVNTSVPSGFDSWVGGFSGLTDTTPEGDPDFDGIANLLEFVLNGNPMLADAEILPDITLAPAAILFSFQRRDDSEIDSIQTFQYGSDLGVWENVSIPATSGVVGTVTITINENGAAPDLVTVSIPTAAGASLYARLKVTRP